MLPYSKLLSGLTVGTLFERERERQSEREREREREPALYREAQGVN